MKKTSADNIDITNLHGMHSYPCKFPALTVKELLTEYCKPGDVVCDPFVGSGTTLVEASLHGCSSVGVDINPIACLISKVKSKPLSEDELLKLTNTYVLKVQKYLLDCVKENYKDTELYCYPSIEHWFQKNVIKELSSIKTFIDKIPEDGIKDVFKAVFSSIVVRVSNQESDTRYAAINKNIKDGYTSKLFMERLLQFCESVKVFMKSLPKTNIDVSVYTDDSRYLTSIKKDSVDIVITSPPYANTYDYYLYHKHRKYWLGIDVKAVMENEIGSRREFSSLKKDPTKWIDDAELSMKQIYRITKKGGNVFIIIGDSVINKNLINNGILFEKLGKTAGFQHISTKSTPLSQHSSAFNPSFQAKEKNEHLIHFVK